MKQPRLNGILLHCALTDIANGKPIVVVTMDPGQWDGFLAGAYSGGHTLLEVVNEQPVRAYRKKRARRGCQKVC